MKCTCSGPVCSCGASGVVKDGAGVSVSATMMDGAAAMTDAQRQAMRDSVRGMPLHQAAALPIYDNVRGTSHGGMNAAEYHALMDGAVSLPHIGGLPPTARNIADAGDKLGAQISYERRVADAWKQRPEIIESARAALQSQDRTPLINDNGQDAYEKRLTDAWKRPAEAI